MMPRRSRYNAGWECVARGNVAAPFFRAQSSGAVTASQLAVNVTHDVCERPRGPYRAMEPHTHLGTTASGTELFLSGDERREMMGILGATGVGKSHLLEHLATQDMARGDGLLLLDPHGPLAEAVI